MRKAVLFILLIVCVQLCTGFLSWLKDKKKEKKEKETPKVEEKIVYVYPQQTQPSFSGGCAPSGCGKSWGGGCGGGKGWGGGRSGGRGGGGRCG